MVEVSKGKLSPDCLTHALCSRKAFRTSPADRVSECDYGISRAIAEPKVAVSPADQFPLSKCMLQCGTACLLQSDAVGVSRASSRLVHFKRIFQTEYGKEISYLHRGWSICTSLFQMLVCPHASHEGSHHSNRRIDLHVNACVRMDLWGFTLRCTYTKLDAHFLHLGNRKVWCGTALY